MDAATYLGIPGVYHVNRRRCGAQSVWNNAANIVVAWIVTLPASGAHGRVVLRYAEIPFTLAITSQRCCRQIGERRSPLDGRGEMCRSELVRFWHCNVRKRCTREPPIPLIAIRRRRSHKPCPRS